MQPEENGGSESEQERILYVDLDDTVGGLSSGNHSPNPEDI